MSTDAIAALAGTTALAGTNAVVSTAAAGTANALTGAATTTTADPTISEGDFLKLFIAQIQNQDPLSPMDPNELTSQLAQFSSLEQLTGVNTRLDTLADLSKQGTTGSLLSLIGRQVTFDGSEIGVTKGKATPVDFTLDQSMSKVTATVRAADGSLVSVVDLGALGAGAQSFTFDGSGPTGTVPDGTYQVEIDALTPGAKVPTPVTTLAVATVDGVDLSATPPVLLVNGLRIPFDQVQQVQAPQS